MSISHRMALSLACLTLLRLTGCNKTPKREMVDMAILIRSIPIHA